MIKTKIVKDKNILLVHAINIHQGGGARLLIALLKSIDSNTRVILNIDKRLNLKDLLTSGIEVNRIKKSIWTRLIAEYKLYRQATSAHRVICFGNLPPLLRLKAFTSVFVQNRYLIDKVSLNKLDFWPRIRISLERLWFRLCILNADQYLVQTSSMQRLLDNNLSGRVPIIVAPIVEINQNINKKSGIKASKTSPQFIYVASGDWHKNHRNLIDAWCLLAMDGIRPHLILTIDEFIYQDLCSWISERVTMHSLKVINVGSVNTSIVDDLYTKSDVLIYPSLMESFGLPLIEASNVGLEIIAAELDYVRDVVRPIHTFDPTSALSIARAVKRYFDFSESDSKFFKPEEFLSLILDKVK